ncbi:CIA30 family protein [Pyxidicoccus xibeiensis]|uniref:CIA30 family protein n=1 Tax=Pyxidicoccus xibeiensis TaxID=2906759 RepID=UPI0020A807A9|nr:CIA30 family protein [Pyxidicoccus xibeiensis]MCP3142041.1 CIA30 family protein [Pyxidicoccus xibeiensis]
MFKPLLLAAALSAALPAFAATTLIRDVRVFDGQRTHEHRNVLIDGTRIADPDFRGKPRAETTIIEGKGRTLMPGLIDSHVHAYRYLDLPLLFGVTTQIDMFTGVSVMQEMTARMQRGENHDRADLFSAGTLATVPGGHGTEYGIPIPTLTRPEQAQGWVDARIAEGSAFIKIVLEPGNGDEPTPSLDLPTMKALVDAAHRRGKLAVVHIATLASARAALEAGADGLVHLFVGEDLAPDDLAAFVKLARSRKAFIIPTFSVMESIAGVQEQDVLEDRSLMALLLKEQVSSLKASHGNTARPEKLRAPRAVVKALRDAGVTLLAGTDAGNAGTQYGASMHHELLSMTQAGLTPSEVLAAATSVPAQAFRLPQRGRIAKGYKADLLLVEGDPTADISATRRIVEVWKDGTPVSPLRASRLKAVAEEASTQQGRALELPPEGRISLFTQQKLGSPFGMGWMPSTDDFMGGKSIAKLAFVEADGQHAAEVSANVRPGFAYPWAGIAFIPGSQPMQAVDLSAAKVLRFRVRGDGQKYSVSMMSKGLSIPVNQPFTAGEGWTEVVMPLSAFKGVEASALTMISFNAGPKPGEYQFQLADVRLTEE